MEECQGWGVLRGGTVSEKCVNRKLALSGGSNEEFYGSKEFPCLSSPLLISHRNHKAKVTVWRESVSRHRAGCQEVQGFFECFIAVRRRHDYVARARTGKLSARSIVPDDVLVNDVMKSLATWTPRAEVSHAALERRESEIRNNLCLCTFNICNHEQTKPLGGHFECSWPFQFGYFNYREFLFLFHGFLSLAPKANDSNSGALLLRRNPPAQREGCDTKTGLGDATSEERSFTRFAGSG